VTHVAIGDYWLEKLSAQQEWRKDYARNAQKEFEAGLAMVREMAKNYIGASMQQENGA
jgi:hypothetical protein